MLFILMNWAQYSQGQEWLTGKTPQVSRQATIRRWYLYTPVPEG
jgi:hypothetical protein